MTLAERLAVAFTSSGSGARMAIARVVSIEIGPGLATLSERFGGGAQCQLDVGPQICFLRALLPRALVAGRGDYGWLPALAEAPVHAARTSRASSGLPCQLRCPVQGREGLLNSNFRAIDSSHLFWSIARMMACSAAVEMAPA